MIFLDALSCWILRNMPLGLRKYYEFASISSRSWRLMQKVAEAHVVLFLNALTLWIVRNMPLGLRNYYEIASTSSRSWRLMPKVTEAHVVIFSDTLPLWIVRNMPLGVAEAQESGCYWSVFLSGCYPQACQYESFLPKLVTRSIGRCHTS